MERQHRNLACFVALVFVAGVLAAVTDQASRTSVAAGATEVEQAAGACAAWDALGAPADGSSAHIAAPGGEALVPDAGGVAGRLDNGLVYYARHNERPGGNLELRLVVDAGSMLEDPDQRGAAHFLEHLLFNGTEQFPGNQLAATLEGLGVHIGADLNASASFDETVYELSVEADDAGAVATALDVLFQWATAATIDPAAVEAERGVILQELQVRLDTPEGRSGQHQSDLVLAGSTYDDKGPGGTAESVAALTPEAIRRFYTDWYRPDLMAVVAVGDVDVAAVEAAIRERFAAMPAAAPTARPRPLGTAATTGDVRIDTFTDPESTAA